MNSRALLPSAFEIQTAPDFMYTIESAFAAAPFANRAMPSAPSTMTSFRILIPWMVRCFGHPTEQREMTDRWAGGSLAAQPVPSVPNPAATYNP